MRREAPDQRRRRVARERAAMTARLVPRPLEEGSMWSHLRDPGQKWPPGTFVVPTPSTPEEWYRAGFRYGPDGK